LLEDPLCEEFLRILCPPDCDIDRLEGDLIAMGVAVEDQTTRGMELAALALTIPSGLAVLSMVLNKVVQSWSRGRGILIDARSGREMELRPLEGAPFGTLVILYDDGTKVERSDLSSIELGEAIQDVVRLSGSFPGEFH
jgi:hypothetical protein